MRKLVVGLVVASVGSGVLADEIRVGNPKIRAGSYSGRAAYVPWSAIWWPMTDGKLSKGWNGTSCFTYDDVAKQYSKVEGIPVTDRSPLLKYDEFVRLATGTDPESAILELHGSANWHHHIYGDYKEELDERGVDYSWFGHCNGWAAAATLEAEPFCPVEVRGIRFDVADLKGLLTESYFRCASDFTGTRYEKPSNDEKENYDRAKELLAALDRPNPPAASEYRAWYERAFETQLSEDYTPAAYREALDHYIEQYDEQYTKAYEDLRPDVFHKILTTVIGQQHGVVVFDISADEAVWNYPAFSYDTQITARSSRVIDGVRRSVWECRTIVTYADDGVSESILGTRTFTKTYTYELYTTSNGYLRGGTWLGMSVNNHPDFAWYPKYNADASTPGENTRLLYSRIKEILPAHHEAKDTTTFELAANGLSSSQRRSATSPITWSQPIPSGQHVALSVTSSLPEMVSVRYFTERVTVASGFIKARREALTPVGEGMSAVVTLSPGTKMVVAQAFDASGRLLAMDEITVRVQ